VKRSISCLTEYTRESFFHKLMNIGLRIFTTPNELSYLRLPFSHIFWSIRTLYHRHKKAIFENKIKEGIRIIQLYRGCQMSNSEINTLKQNVEGYL
jgi:hypothetical protein